MEIKVFMNNKLLRISTELIMTMICSLHMVNKEIHLSAASDLQTDVLGICRITVNKVVCSEQITC